jgi:hypothetical protein
MTEGRMITDRMIDSPQRAKWGHYATLFPLFPVPIPGQVVPEKTKTYEFFM